MALFFSDDTLVEVLEKSLHEHVPQWGDAEISKLEMFAIARKMAESLVGEFDEEIMNEINSAHENGRGSGWDDAWDSFKQEEPYKDLEKKLNEIQKKIDQIRGIIKD